MLFVALRYYQQSMLRDDDWVEDDGRDDGDTETSWQGQIRGQRQRHGPTKVEASKMKKGS